MNAKQVITTLFYLKPLLNFIVFACLSFIVYLFLFAEISMQNDYALACLLLAAWSLLFSATLGLLANSPNSEQAVMGWYARLKFRLAKRLFFFAVCAFTMVSLALLYVTLRLLNL